MAGKSAVLTVKILTDASQSQKGLDKAASGVSKFESGLNKMVPAAAATVGAIALIGTAAVKSASRTQQAMGALDSVFGKNAETVKGWAADAADAVGLSKAEYGELASIIGAQLNTLGLSADEALSGTKSLIEMGADLAATFGGTTSDAVNALSAALRGEADPAERYGLNLKQSAINAKLAEQGLSGLTGEALQAAKTQAILALATEQSGGALGQFQRETDSAAGSAQIASAQFENASSALGDALLPIVAAVTSQLAELAKWVSENSTLVSILVGIVGAIAAVILIMAAAMKVAAIAQWALNSALLANPITWVVLAVVALVAAIVILWNNSEAFRDFFIGMWEAIVAGVTAAWDWIVKAAQAAWDFIVGVWEGVADAASDAWNSITGWISDAWNFIMAVAKIALQAYIGVWKAIFSAAVSVWNAIVSAIQAAWNWIMNIARQALSVYIGIWQGIFNAARSAWNGIVSAVQGAINFIISAARSVGSFVNGIWQSILAAGRNVWNALVGVVGSAMNAILAPIRWVQDAFNNVVSAIQDVISWISRIAIPDLSALNPFKSSAPTASAAVGFTATPTTPMGALGSPRLGTSVLTARAGGGLTININGGLSTADDIARAVERVVTGRTRRTGGIIIDRRAR